jgi:hypothetical protein
MVVQTSMKGCAVFLAILRSDPFVGKSRPGNPGSFVMITDDSDHLIRNKAEVD